MIKTQRYCRFRISVTAKWLGVVQQLMKYLEGRHLFPSERRSFDVSVRHDDTIDQLISAAKHEAKRAGKCFSPWVLQASYEKLIRDRPRDCSDRFLSRSAWIIQAIKEKLDANQDN